MSELNRIGDTKDAFCTLLRLQDDEAVSKLIAYGVAELSARSDATPADTVRALLDGGAFETDENWNAAERRTMTTNARKLYAGAAIVLQPRRPQG